MRPIKSIYIVLLAGLTLLWLIADPLLSVEYQFFTLRHALINYSGIIAMGVMSVGMMLAIRPVSIESFIGGLDKTYRLHKWLGITGLVFSVIHYLWVNVPKWMVGWDMLEKPAHGPRPEQSSEILSFFQKQRGLAESIGEWAFYAALILMVLALLKWFPYRYFFKTHRLIAIAYLFLVFHSIVLMEFSYWGEVIAPLMTLLMIGGTVGAFISLFRRVGFGRRAVGEIEQLRYHKDNRVLNVAIKLKDRWFGHDAGQFAFVTFDKSEGPHPFTVSSAWSGDGTLSFDIKGIGDYTNTLPASLKVGDLVTVEGPYGRFNFNSSKPRQIWVAGGIGITPFIARIQALISRADGKMIDLFYSTDAPDDAFINRIRDSARAANVRLHLLIPSRDGWLNAERIRQAIPDWQEADIWFCGPKGFGQSLRRDFNQAGLPSSGFHQELFEMR